MAATIKIEIVSSASGTGIPQVTKDLKEMDAAARAAPGGFSVLGGAAAAALGGVVVSAASAAAGAVVGFVGDSISAAGDFEGAVNNLAAISGDALAEAGFSFDDVSQKALELGQNTAFSASESIAAMTELVKGGIPVADVMTDATDATLALAAATGTDLTNAAEIMSKQFGVWNETGVESGQIADLLTQAANASTVGVEDLALGLANAGGTAKVAGVEFEDLVQSMALIAPNFSSASDAGTSFKTFLSRLIPTTEPATEMMVALGLATEDGTSKFYDAQGAFIGMEAAAQLLHDQTKDLTEQERLLAFQTIFGADAIRAAAAIADAGAEGFNAMGVSMAGAGTAAETAAIQNQGFGFAMDSMKGSMETLQIVIGTMLLPVLTSLLNDVISPAINTVTTMAQAFGGNTEAMAALSPQAQAVVTALQGVIAIVQQAIAWFTQGGGAVSSWGAKFPEAQAAITAAMTAIQGFVTAVLTTIQTFWAANGEEIMATVGTTWAQVQTIIGTVVEIIATIISTVFTAITDFLNNHGAEIQRVLEFAWNGVQNVITLVMNTIQGIVTTVLGIVTGDWEKANEGISQIVEGLATFINDQFNNILSLIMDLGPGFLDAATGLAQSIIDGMVSGIEQGISSVISAAKDMAQKALDAAMDIIQPGSPSKVFTALGLTAPQGLALGMMQGTPMVAQAGAVMAGAGVAGAARVYNQQRSITVNQTINNGPAGFRQDSAIIRSVAGGI